MATIPFPPQILTDDDERAIERLLRAGGAYSYVQEHGREPCLALFDRALRLRGRIAKRHGVYVVSDARGYELLRTRRLEDILGALAE